MGDKSFNEAKRELAESLFRLFLALMTPGKLAVYMCIVGMVFGITFLIEGDFSGAKAYSIGIWIGASIAFFTGWWVNHTDDVDKAIFVHPKYDEEFWPSYRNAIWGEWIPLCPKCGEPMKRMIDSQIPTGFNYWHCDECDYGDRYPISWPGNLRG